MKACIRVRPCRTAGSRDPWALQPVSRIVGPQPSEFIRRRTWTAPTARLNNGISAVTSLCLVDESSARGPPVVITGDEDGGIAVERVLTSCDNNEGDVCQQSSTSELRQLQLHQSCINTIKLLPDSRGFVCASDDGVLSAVATLEMHSESNLQRATLALHGHSGFVTDCDTATFGQTVVSSSYDGRILLWDPVRGNKPVSSVSIGRPVNSVCFSPGDPYAFVCAPERFGLAQSSGGGRHCVRGNELVQIWDLRSLKCFRDIIPSTTSGAFGEPETITLSHPASDMELPSAPEPLLATVQNDLPTSSKALATTASRSSAKLPSWLTSGTGSQAATASPPAPRVRRSAWADSITGSESCSSDGSPARRRNMWLIDEQDASSTPHTEYASSKRSYSESISSLTTSREYSGAGRRRSSDNSRSAARVPDSPAVVLGQTQLPTDSGCLHLGPEGKTWVPGRLLAWQPGKRRARVAARRRRETGENDGQTYNCTMSTPHSPICQECRSGQRRDASVFSVQVTPDGRGILTASRDRTVTLWDTQSKQVVYRFGHSHLSSRARPVLSGFASRCRSEFSRWSKGACRVNGGFSGADVFAGLTNGEVRAWRLQSRFPHRVFKPARRHEGFEVTCLASSRDGLIFASADSSGKVCVQLATAGEASSSSRCVSTTCIS